MVDVTSIVGGLQAVEHGLKIAKTLRNADFEFEKSELKLQMAELMVALADAKIGLTSAKEQISELEVEVRRLAAFRARRVRNESGMYLEIDDCDQVIDGAFCSRCWDVEKMYIRIIDSLKPPIGMGLCPQCKTDYQLFRVQNLLPGSGDS